MLRSRTKETWFIEVLEQVTIRSTADIRKAAVALRKTALSLGNFQVAACANISSKEPMVDGNGRILASEVFGWRNYGEQWWSEPRIALISPLALACRYESEPFWCNAVGIHTQEHHSTKTEPGAKDFYERPMPEAAIVVPIHLPFGQIGAVGFQPKGADRENLSNELVEFGDLLGLFARKFVASYVNVMDKWQWTASDLCLSKREVECLRWAAVGKTDHEIAAIFARKYTTVRFHIQNAAVKLNAANRVQAVFKAGQLGYLGSLR